MKRRTGPKPLCRCGCGLRVKGYENTWATPACVPKLVRSEAAKRGRATFAYRRRALLFRTALDRLTEEGKTITRERLLDAMSEIYRTGYENGWHANEFKHVGRNRAKQTQERAA